LDVDKLEGAGRDDGVRRAVDRHATDLAILIGSIADDQCRRIGRERLADLDVDRITGGRFLAWPDGPAGA
jgi:hypothetical protein